MLSQGAQAILDIVGNHKEDVVFLPDSKSLLDALACHGEHELRVKLSKPIESRRVVRQWIPAHCGISGNEKSDGLAKRGANMQQENLPITIKQKQTIITNMFRVNTIHDDYHKLEGAGQVILIRLRTENNRLNARMYKKIKLVPSSRCICNIEDQTTQHILQRCPNHTNIRNQLWPDNTTLQQKQKQEGHSVHTTVLVNKGCAHLSSLAGCCIHVQHPGWGVVFTIPGLYKSRPDLNYLEYGQDGAWVLE